MKIRLFRNEKGLKSTQFIVLPEPMPKKISEKSGCLRKHFRKGTVDR